MQISTTVHFTTCTSTYYSFGQYCAQHQCKKEMLKKIDSVVRGNLDIEIALDFVDMIEEETCKTCRKIWKNYRNFVCKEIRDFLTR